MRIDWIVAAVTFLMFLSWAFSYYTYSQRAAEAPRAEAAMRAADAVISYMRVETLSMPVNITIGYAAPGSVVWAYVNWTGEFRNSTRVTLSRDSADGLACMVSGNRLYWEADLAAGGNTFFIGQAAMEVPMNCSATLSETDENWTSAWAAEPGSDFSSERNAEACALMNSDYPGVKDTLGITYDFRVEVSDGGTPYYCGRAQVPQGRDTFSFPYSGRLWEGGESNMTVVVW